MDPQVLKTLIFGGASFIGIALGWFARIYIEKKIRTTAENEAQRLRKEAQKEAETLKKQAIYDGREEIHKERLKLEQEINSRRSEIKTIEDKISRREDEILQSLKELKEKEKFIDSMKEKLSLREKEIDQINQKNMAELERISGLSIQDAKLQLISSIEDAAKKEAVKSIKKIEEEADRIGERKAKKIVTLAIQRCAVEHTVESTVSVVNLPSDEMKGRIIGREGRNIREFEKLTGVDLIIDDTPEAVVISAFDPVRREIAKVSLERLVLDGRIHPARIEEIIKKVQEDIKKSIQEAGDAAVYECNLTNIPDELVKLIGRLKYRYSYGQNVLQHSTEVAHLAGIMAAELGANVQFAKRIGLLHDIGKAVDHEVEGTHAGIGADYLLKFGGHPAVAHEIRAHHGEVEAKTIEGVLVQAADAISASRPGARRENLEIYIKRLETLEKMAYDFKGVDKAYAIQAGREIRVVVDNKNVSDVECEVMARELAQRVEDELNFPGQIKITVIRETRVIDYAK